MIFIGSLIERNINARKNYLNNITNERKIWRDKIRNLTVDLYSSYPNYKKIKSEFQVRLNPNDDQDKEILSDLEEIIKLDRNFIFADEQIELDELKNIISSRVSLLLKHDWERSKKEASIFRINPIQLIFGIIYLSVFITNSKFYFHHINLNFVNILPFITYNLIFYIFLHLLIKFFLKKMAKNENYKTLFAFFGLPFR